MNLDNESSIEKLIVEISDVSYRSQNVIKNLVNVVKYTKEDLNDKKLKIERLNEELDLYRNLSPKIDVNKIYDYLGMAEFKKRYFKCFDNSLRVTSLEEIDYININEPHRRLGFVYDGDFESWVDDAIVYSPDCYSLDEFKEELKHAHFMKTLYEFAKDKAEKRFLNKKEN